MADQFLSQDEVDALLAGVNGDEPDDEIDAEAEGIRNYDLAHQERIVRGRMPTLEIVNERFARNFRTGMFSLTRRNPEISVGPVQVQKYSAFLANLVVPTNLNVVQVNPLRGNGLIVCEPQLVFAVIDTLFGGTGKLPTRIEGRDFSPTEQRIISNIVSVFIDAYAEAWRTVYPLQLEYVRSEMQTQFASVATPSEIVVTTRFWLEIGEAAGAVHICIPYGTLEPIREVLYSSLNTDQVSQNRSWVKKLSSQLEEANLDLVAELGKTDITFGELINLSEGDFVELDLQELLDVSVSNVPFMKCRYGVSEGKYAIKISEFLTKPEALVNGAEND